MTLSRTQTRLAVATFALGFGLGATTLASSAAETTTCTKDRGTVTCTTTSSPGKNQGGVGSTSDDETQGNTTNKSPAPQELADDECTQQRPAGAKGSFSC